MTALSVLSVAAEGFPLVKTGGLADVTGALPAALAAEGVIVRTLLPGYPAVMAAIKGGKVVLSLPSLFGGGARVLAATAHGLDLLVLDAPHLFDRPGNPYLGPDGRDWPDNPIRFAALARAAATIATTPALRPDIVHCHDWQSGLVPAYLHYTAAKAPPTVMTVHNLAFPGKAAPSLLATLGLPPHAYAIDGVEFHGTISLLKAGLQFADRITTVSPTYATEIQTRDAGMGFDGLLHHRAAALTGILNGIDTTIWNPATDPALAAPFSATDRTGRPANKAALQRELGLSTDAPGPLFAVISRLTHQKGMDLLLEALPTLLRQGGQLAVLGTGEAWIESALRDAVSPGRIACVLGYDEALAHRIQAGADALLVPSRFEPCGLTQLCALRYGCVPVVARVGGLADTVIDANPAALAAGVATGIQFAPESASQLEAAIRRTAALYSDSTAWLALQANGTATDVSWRGPARQYAALYRSLLAARA